MQKKKNMWNTALDARWDAYVLDIHDILATTGDLSMPVGDPCVGWTNPQHIFWDLRQPDLCPNIYGFCVY